MKKWYQLIFRRNSSCADWDVHEREDSSGLFRTLLICQFVQDDVMVTSSSRSSWGLLFRSANWPGISIFESSYSSKTESNILKSWNSKSWNWRKFHKNWKFRKILVKSTFVFKYFKIFYKERIKLTLTYGKISKPVSNGGYSRRSGKSSPVPKWSFLTTSLKIKLGNSFDFR